MQENQTANRGNGSKNVCNCSHHRVVPFLILLIGLTFLLGSFNIIPSSIVNVVWPLLIIIIGGTKLNEHNCNCC